MPLENSIKLGKYYFYGLPQKLIQSDYQEVCHMAVDNLKGNPNIKAIYLVGQWVPGISDIDIVLVYKNDFDPKIKIISPWQLSDKAKFIFLHSYDIFNIENFKNWFYLSSDEKKLKLLYGQSVDINKPKEKLSDLDYRFLQTSIIFDFLINKLLILPARLNLSRINTRELICEVNSIKYTLDILKKVTGEKIATEFIAQMTALRNNWFKENLEINLKKLINLLNQSINLSLEIAVLINQFLKDNLGQDNIKLLKEDLIFKNNKYCISFKKSDNWNKQLYLDNFLRDNKVSKSKRESEYNMVLPLELSYFLLAYAGFEGKFSHWIRKNLINCPQFNFSWNKGIKKHTELMNRRTDNKLIQKRIVKIPFSYGFKRNKWLNYYFYFSRKFFSSP